MSHSGLFVLSLMPTRKMSMWHTIHFFFIFMFMLKRKRIGSCSYGVNSGGNLGQRIVLRQYLVLSPFSCPLFAFSAVGNKFSDPAHFAFVLLVTERGMLKSPIMIVDLCLSLLVQLLLYVFWNYLHSNIGCLYLSVELSLLLI